MNVLHHFDLQFEALVILLQETHYTNAEKLVLPSFQLTVSFSNRKHGLATFVHKQLRHTLLNHPPPTSNIKMLSVEVDKYIIVNVYKPPPTRLRPLDLPVIPYPCLYAGNFNCRYVDCDYNNNIPDNERLARWVGNNSFALLYIAKDAASFYSGRLNTGTNPGLAFANVGSYNYLRDRRNPERSPGQNFDLRLSHHQDVLCQCHARPLSDGTFARLNGVTTLL